MREITRLVIHCTDSPDTAVDVGLTEVRNWHLQKGWSDIGYHWLVDKKGLIWMGRREEKTGAHAYGYNKNSIGMVWVGRNTCNVEQWSSLVLKAVEICKRYQIPIENVVGHCELPGVAKTCPNLNMTKFRNAVEQMMRGE